MIRSCPSHGRWRGFNFRRQVAGGASSYRHNVDISSCQSFIAHYTFDKRYGLPIGRDMRLRDLPVRLVDLAHLTIFRVDGIQSRDPPVVVA